MKQTLCGILVKVTIVPHKYVYRYIYMCVYFTVALAAEQLHKHIGCLIGRKIVHMRLSVWLLASFMGCLTDCLVGGLAVWLTQRWLFIYCRVWVSWQCWLVTFSLFGANECCSEVYAACNVSIIAHSTVTKTHILYACNIIYIHIHIFLLIFICDKSRYVCPC